MIHHLKDCKASEVSIPCDYMTEKIYIHKWDVDDDFFYWGFYIDSFYIGQCLTWIWWDRIKMAWLALRKGNYIHQEISMSLTHIKELRDDLNVLIEQAERGGEG